MVGVEPPACSCPCTTYRWSKNSYDCSCMIIKKTTSWESPSENESTIEMSDLEPDDLEPLFERLNSLLLENARRISEMQNFIQDLVNIRQESIKNEGHSKHEHMDIGMPLLRTLPKDLRDRLRSKLMAKEESRDALITNQEDLTCTYNRLEENLFCLGLSVKLVQLISDNNQENGENEQMIVE